MGMRVEIDIKELAGELWTQLRSQIEQVNSQFLPTLLARKEAALYLGISVRLFDSLGIPRVEITDRRVRYRREDLDLFAQERIRA